MSDHAFAERLAGRAGELLLALRRGATASHELGARGDAESQRLLYGAIREAHPNDAILSEEAIDDRRRLDAERVWIIDPLDGTREYSEPSRTDWAVHVALWAHGEIVAAAVALPARGVVLSTASDRPHAGARPGRGRCLLVSRTRPPAFADRVAEEIGAELIGMGSAGAKTAAVVMDEADAYVHAGGQHEWDSAAPVGVALAAGLHASRVSGDALRYNQPDPVLPDLLICRPELAETIIRVIADAP